MRLPRRGQCRGLRLVLILGYAASPFGLARSALTFAAAVAVLAIIGLIWVRTNAGER